MGDTAYTLIYCCSEPALAGARAEPLGRLTFTLSSALSESCGELLGPVHLNSQRLPQTSERAKQKLPPMAGSASEPFHSPHRGMPEVQLPRRLRLQDLMSPGVLSQPGQQ